MSESPAMAPKKRKRKKWWIWLIVLAVIAAVLVVPRLLGGGASNVAQAVTYTEQPVVRGDVTAEITGTGTLEAADSYIVTTLAEGTILTADFEEGDRVEKDDVLYTIDASNVSGNLEQAELSLRQQQRSYNKSLENREKLNVTAKSAGRVTELSVEVGDEIQQGQKIATVQDTDVMSLAVPFLADEAASLAVGQTASVTLDGTFETLAGTVSKVAALDSVLPGNRIVRTVTVEVKNPGGIAVGQTATAAVGSAMSADSGAFTSAEEKPVSAEIGGTVAAIRVSEGDRVASGDILVTLSSSDLDDQIQSARDSLRNAEISMENRRDQLDNYTITSPIAGTIIDKFYKAGENSELNKTLCTIYDLSYLTMTLSVDELDISDIAVGQDVQITADAVAGKTFAGVVTKVSPVGTSSNGVATYPVTIRIDDTQGLLPGMTVDATIVLQSAKNVLTIPSAALRRGNRVMVTADSPSAKNGEPVEDDSGETKYYTVEVVIGTSDDDTIEVVSGLQDGDTVAYRTVTRSDSSGFPFGGMGMGGMGGNYGGQRPSGNWGGGNRSGGASSSGGSGQRQSSDRGGQ